MQVSWIAITSAAVAAGFMYAAPQPAPSTLSSCLNGCNRAKLSSDDRATCKIQCERLDDIRRKEAAAPGPGPITHAHPPTHMLPPQQPSAQSKAQIESQCRSQCAHEAAADRPTCQLNCKAAATSAPSRGTTSVSRTYSTGPTTTHTYPQHTPSGQYTAPQTYPQSYPSTTTPHHAGQWDTTKTAPAGAYRPAETSSQAAQRQRCLTDCYTPGRSATDLETCKLNCNAVGYVMSQPMQRRVITDGPPPSTTAGTTDAQRRAVIQSSGSYAGTATAPSYRPGTGPTTTFKKTTDTAVLQRCASNWYNCDRSCGLPEASCLDDCNNVRAGTDRETCKLTCTAVRDSCRQRCTSARNTCEQVR